MRSRRVALLAMALGIGAALVGIRLAVEGGRSVGPGARAVVAERPAAIERASSDGAATEPARVASDAGGIAPPAAPEPARVEVLALRAHGVEPVEGAQLWCWSDPDAPQRAARDRAEAAWRSGGFETLLEQASGPYELDVEGRGWIPAAERGALVVARAPGWFGSEWLSPGDPEPFLVELHADRTLLVRVVDGAGRPVAGVRASLREVWDGEPMDLLHALSDDQGIARLEHAGAELARRLDPETTYALALAEPLWPRVERALALDALPEEPVELVLPATGAVELVALDSEGAPFLEPLDLSLGLLPPEDARGEQNGFSLTREHVVDGRARFEHVSPGLALYAGAYRHDGLGWAHLTAPPLGAAGELVTLTLRLEPESPTVRGRALDEARAPLAEVELVVDVERKDGRRWWSSARTDADGRFRAPLHAGPEEERAVVVRTQLDSGAEAARARVLLPALEGSQDVGDLVLRPSPVLAAGRVLDERGAPVPQASVVARDTRGTLASARVDGEGRFELRGESPDATLHLYARRPGAKGEELELPRGTQGIVLRLPCTGALSGRVLLDPSLAFGRAAVEIVEPESGRRGAICALAAEGRFAARELPVGRHRVRVVALGEELASVEDVRVEPGAVTSDSRLDPLDLREPWRALELEVVDERGVPIPEARVLRWRGDDRHHALVLPGRALLASDGAPLELTVHAERYLPRHLPAVTRSQRVALREGPRLRFELVGVAPPQLPLTLELRLTPSEERPRPTPTGVRTKLDADGRALSRADFVGGARVSLTLVGRNPSQRARVPLLDDGRIELLDTTLEQRVELAPTAEAFAEALAELER